MTVGNKTVHFVPHCGPISGCNAEWGLVTSKRYLASKGLGNDLTSKRYLASMIYDFI